MPDPEKTLRYAGLPARPGRPWQTAGEARLPEAHRLALEHLRQALEALAEAEPWAQVTAGRHVRLAVDCLLAPLRVLPGRPGF